MSTVSNILKSLLPKDRKFFPLFKSFSDQVNLASSLYLSLLKSTNINDRIEILSRISECESEGDRIVKSIVDNLTRTFITPFDREEIHLLASNLDNILDDFLVASKKIVKYGLGVLPKELIQLSEEISICSGFTKYCLYNLDNYQSDKYSKSIVDISNQKEKTDDLFLSGMANLYSSGIDQLSVLKIREIFLSTDDIMKNFHMISFALNKILIKNS